MFYSLSGKIVYKDEQCAAIDCSGIAFRVSASANTLKELGGVGENAFVYTYLSVREDGVELFGFCNEKELSFFKLLISVSGVGAKMAMAVLSELTADMLALCISSGDAKTLTRAPGIGQKIAQRIILELKDKAAKMTPSAISSKEAFVTGASVFNTKTEEAASALAALGYSYTKASEVLACADRSLSVEDMIKSALKELSRR